MEQNDLRADVHADASPFDVLRGAMRQIETPSLFPIHSEFVLVTSGGNLRVTSGLHIRIDANRDRGNGRAALLLLCGFFEQRFEFRFCRNIEKENSSATTASCRSVAERLAHFFACLAYAGKNDAIAANAYSMQMMEFAAGHDIEAAAQLCEIPQYCQIAVGLPCEAQRVRQSSQSLSQLAVRVFDSAAAIDISRRSESGGNLQKRHAIAVNLRVVARAPRRLLPGKMRRKRRGIDERKLFVGVNRRRGHRTLSTTSVRSSESGVESENQSTSRSTRSAR